MNNFMKVSLVRALCFLAFIQLAIPVDAACAKVCDNFNNAVRATDNFYEAQARQTARQAAENAMQAQRRSVAQSQARQAQQTQQRRVVNNQAQNKINSVVQKRIDLRKNYSTTSGQKRGLEARGNGKGVVSVRAPSPRTQAILDRFKNSKKVEVYDRKTGVNSSVEIVEGLTRRQIKVSDLGNLQRATGNEFALLRGQAGDRVLIQGSKMNVAIPEIYVRKGYRWSGHSHPNGVAPSAEDRIALSAFRQESSVIKSADTGEAKRFYQKEDLSNWLPGSKK